jgi:O-antigen/teichoic acid export membrane protein
MEKEDLSPHYIKVSNMLSSIFVTINIALIFMAKPIVLLIYGAKYSGSIIFFRIISMINIFTFPFITTMAHLAVSQGRVKRIFYWTIFKSISLISTIYIASHYSILTICYSLLLVNILLIPIYYHFIVKSVLKIGFIDYILPTIKPLVLSTIAAFSTIFYLSQWLNIILQIVLISFQGLLVYALLSHIFNREFTTEFIQFVGLKKKS